MNEHDQQWMRYALQLAQQAEQNQEVPIGAVLVYQDKVIGEGWNQPIQTHDPTAHAEIIAIRQAAQTVKNYRLLDTTLYVTLEPCAMCAGAIIQARIKRLVYAASDARAGAVDSVFPVIKSRQLNHHVDYEAGLMADESVQLLQRFFRARRKRQA